jgi:signal transduction histidine kinase
MTPAPRLRLGSRVAGRVRRFAVPAGRHVASLFLLWTVTETKAADAAGTPPNVAVLKVMASGVEYPVVPQDGGRVKLPRMAATEFALAPVRVPLRDLPLSVTFGAMETAAKKPVRIRYRLEGWDERWRDMEGMMWLVLRFLDERGVAISSASFIRQGESAGWRGEVARSAFHATTDYAVAPPRTRRVQLLLVSGGTPRTTGVWVVRRLKLSLVPQENSPEAGTTLLDVAALSGAQLDSPRGVPDDWTRDGTSLETPQLLSAGSPARPMLALVDSDPTNTGGWLARARNVVPVEPGSALRLDSEEFYSIGRGGEFTETYPNLRAQNYTFLVHEVDPFGRETGAGVRLPIVIVPPVTQTFWFRGLVVGALFLLLAGAVRYATWRKVQTQLARLERQRAIEVERTRIARDLHDEMGARLTQISLLSARAIEANAAQLSAVEPLAQVQRAAHALASTLDEIVWATSPQHDTVAAFADHLSHYAVEALAAGGVRCRLEVPTLLPATELSSGHRFRLMMVVKEVLTNVLRHARATEVKIRLALEGSTLAVTLRDDGCGFGEAGKTRRNGIGNMHERMREIGGTCEIVSTAGGGTTVELRLPLKEASA